MPGKVLASGISGSGAINATTTTTSTAPFTALTAGVAVRPQQARTHEMLESIGSPGRTLEHVLHRRARQRVIEQAIAAATAPGSSSPRKPINSIGAPSAVLMNGSDTGSRNGIARMAQKTSRPCSPTSASNSRNVTWSPSIAWRVVVSASDRRTSGLRNWTAVIGTAITPGWPGQIEDLVTPSSDGMAGRGEG